MDDTTLRALFTVIQCGSFSKAAAQLGYTQSGITHMMNRLETELGCRLFQRTSHGVHLSKAGEHLLPYMQDVLAACDTLRQEASGSSEASSRVLRVGCYGSIARGWMPQVLPAFRRLHPEIRVEVLVRGRELLQAGIPPGRPLGEALHRLLEAVIVGAADNTPEGLIAYLEGERAAGQAAEKP